MLTLMLLVGAIVAAFMLAKAGLLGFVGVALSIFWLLNMGGCTQQSKPYCRTKQVHERRVRDDDPESERLVNEHGLPVIDSRNQISGDDGSGNLAHARGW